MPDSSLPRRLERAAARRESLRARTSALRLVDGLGDGFEDLEIEEFAGAWLVQTREGRPPDEVIAAAGARPVYWKLLGDKNPPVRLHGRELAEPFPIEENGLRFLIDFQGGYSQGLFLDQRDNRLAIRRASSPGRSVLNCFAYTCAFGVAAAAGGATTVNVDLSRRSLDWGRRNYLANHLDPALHEFLHGDVFQWLKRFARKGHRFDLIVLDPPTFSRSDNGVVFRIESGFGALVAAAAAILAPDGTILCSTNQRSLSERAFRRIILDPLEEPRKWRLTASPMPEDFTGDHYLKSLWLKR